MRIHSDILMRADFASALSGTGLDADGVYLDGVTSHGSRKRARAYEVTLRAIHGKDRNGKTRRWPNGGAYGAETGYGNAATYDEWGYWIARLYGSDPRAIIGPYKSRADFLLRTDGAYPITFPSIG
jgi:hypothetical protein